MNVERNRAFTAHVSVAIASGIRVPFASPANNHGGLEFSAAGLSGAATSASLSSVTDRSELTDSIKQLLADAGLRVDNVQVRNRDIDGCTVLISIVEDRERGWEFWGATSDDLVGWAGREVVGAIVAARASIAGADSHGAPKARALWSHTVMVCRRRAHHDTTEDPHCDVDVARRLLPTDFESVVQNGDVVYLGLHASLICVRDADAAMRVVELMDELHGWWTASWLLDQSLLDTVMATSAALSRDPADRLVHIPDVIAHITNEGGTLRARMDTFKIGLGGLEWPVWEAATRRWELADNLDAISAKRQLLLDMHGAFLAALQSRRSERLNQIAGFFAAVSSVASLVAVIAFVFPTFDQHPGHLFLRLFVTSVAAVVTVFVLLWSSRLLLRGRRSGP